MQKLLYQHTQSTYLCFWRHEKNTKCEKLFFGGMQPQHSGPKQPGCCGSTYAAAAAAGYQRVWWWCPAVGSMAALLPASAETVQTLAAPTIQTKTAWWLGEVGGLAGCALSGGQSSLQGAPGSSTRQLSVVDHCFQKGCANPPLHQLPYSSALIALFIFHFLVAVNICISQVASQK